ncbi:lipase family protein [Arabiibacter massiliensis]|uniref:lipase family protein n=1 Tax=Arabiibacter massiliensis TaxID=1870985 RepID=UPI0009BB78B2|nr:lipase family protein [Arabiibacter massiliensis]
MQTNPVRRCMSVLGSLLACIAMVGLFMAQVRYLGFESGIVDIPRAEAAAADGKAPAPSRSTVVAEYCSEVVSASDPANPAGRTSTQLTFDDFWLLRDSHAYQHELATACAVLSAVCNSESQFYSGVPGSVPYAEQTLGRLGFENVRTDSYALRSSILDEASSLLLGSPDVAAYTLASKPLASEDGGRPTTLVFVGIRGTYGAEWLSNFNILGQGVTGPDHRGFKAAEEEVAHAVRAYVRELGLDPDRTRILITGHSRGGAIANLLAADLGNPDAQEAALAPSSGIFAYTFAAPCATRAGNRHDPAFDNIFNVVNEADIVTQLPLSSWGFGRYGSTIELPDVASDGFDDSFAVVQTAYRQNTGFALSSDLDALAALHSFGSNASGHVSAAEDLASPLGLVGVVQSLIGLDVSAALSAHYPDTYIAWMQALDDAPTGA